LALVFWPQSKPQLSLCAIVIDRTESVANPNVGQEYAGLAQSALRNCAVLDANTAVWQISSSPNVEQNPLTFPFSPPAGQSNYQSQILHKDLEQAADQVSSFINQPIVDGPAQSDILGVIAEAAASLKKEQHGSSNAKLFMVVLTDGMQISGGVSVASLENFMAEPKSLVSQTDSEYSPIDLEGIHAAFYGVGGPEIAPGGEVYPPWYETKIRRYWEMLFQSNGGDLCTYQNVQPNSNVLCGGN